MPIYSKKQTQIKAESRAQVETLLFEQTFIKVLAEYSDYSNVFLAKNVVEFLENIGIKKHTIGLEKYKQLLFNSICTLEPVK